jgi:hypothetical protein
VIRFHDCRCTAPSIMRSLRIPPMIVAGMPGHSLAILMTTYAHLARFTRFARYVAIFQESRMRQLDSLAKAAPLVSQQNTLLN